MARTLRSLAILRGAQAAKKLHRDMGLKDRATSGVGFIDVFETIDDLNIPLVFKPLSALGWYLPKPLHGIMITTLRGLHIQRFTGAHELGHAVLEHKGSVDKTILERAPSPGGDGRDLQEVEADAFAAEFLLPRWLFAHHVQKQGWSVESDLKNPAVVYQLSLRVGASYEATCWGLVSHQIISPSMATSLLKAKIARLKADIGGEFRPEDSWADTWKLTARDNLGKVLGNPEDLLRVELEEMAGAGFQWDATRIASADYELLSDESVFSQEPLHYGASTKRILIFRPKSTGRLALELREAQPWMPATEAEHTFHVELNLLGQEVGGASTAHKRKLGMIS